MTSKEKRDACRKEYSARPEIKLRRALASKEWMNKPENKEKSAEWFKKNKEKHYKIRREGHLKSQYGITTEHYNEMFINQNGCCKICGIHQSVLTQRLSVDHCHISNKVRGLLCKKCNTGLGNFSDNIEFLKQAIFYLNENDKNKAGSRDLQGEDDRED